MTVVAEQASESPQLVVLFVGSFRFRAALRADLTHRLPAAHTSGNVGESVDKTYTTKLKNLDRNVYV